MADETFDVIVAGFGFAGAASAISAADGGARVLLLEKGEKPGGISVCSAGGVRIARDAAAALTYLRTTNADTSPDESLCALADGMASIVPFIQELADAAARAELIRYYVDLVAKHGGKIEFIHAHRQSSKSRVSDPGSRIWQACGVWAINELGLSAGPPGWSAGGYALPDAWTGEPNGVRYSSRVDGRLS